MGVPVAGGVWVEMLGPDLRILRDPPAFEQSTVTRLASGDRLADWLVDEDARRIEERLRTVLRTGRPIVNWRCRVHLRAEAQQTRHLAVSAFRTPPGERPPGVLVVLIDVTDYYRTRWRLSLLYRSAARIGGSLDVATTAQALADTLVPDLGDLAAVDLAEAVFTGEEPALEPSRQRQRRAAVSGPWPPWALPIGAPLPPLPSFPELLEFQSGRPVVIDDVAARFARPEGDSEFMRLTVPEQARSGLVSPLYARGRVLGAVTLWRMDRSPPFDEEDARLLQEIASRGALSVDNARRYTRERTIALTLQRSLLPETPAELPAARAAGSYLPASGTTGVGGDWFDVIELSSLRVAFVVGDVTGHGLRASATMGRLRTAIHALADLDLPPDELLVHLDDLVARFVASAPPATDPVTATCLYAVYDPLTRRLEAASAGHPPPVLIRPGHPAEFVALEPGPPLGVNGLPFESTAVDLPEGSILALYTNGLVDHDRQAAGRSDGARSDIGRRDIEGGMHRLLHRLDDLCPPHRPWPTPAEIGDRLLDELAPGPTLDDIALLLAQTRAVPPADTAFWEFPADPAVVARARTMTARQLSEWGLDELTFTAELVISELVTNAIRHAGAPVGLRLIRGPHVLICEVSDPSSTQPHLRRARETDEYGRGLFLVAQVTTRWGSRYTATGKTIWTELPVDSAGS